MNVSVDRILSIQSHVVSGYAGNKSACFPLQVLGFEVDFINSVQLSNHTGYKVAKGQVLHANDLSQLFEGLQKNDLHHYSHLLTGYMGSTSFCSEVISVVKELKKTNPDMIYVCDPVMGDNNKMYVPPDILPLYKDHLVPMANLLTPNQFEAELLTGVTIKSEDDAIQAMQILHDKGVEIVVISSAKLTNSKVLKLLASMVKNGMKASVQMDIPELDANFTGTGDLFAAVMLAWMSRTNNNLKTSCENAVNTLQSVLQRTLKYAREHAGPDGKLARKVMELKLIQSKKDIENPPQHLVAKAL